MSESLQKSPADSAPLSGKITDLAPGQRAEGVFVVRKKVRRDQDNGNSFLLFQLGDQSGQINAILWQGAEIVDAQIQAGDLAHVEGDVQVYQKTRQIRVQRILRADPSEFDVSQFLPCSVRNLDELYEQLLAAVDSVVNPFLRRLYSDIFRDPTIRSRYKCMPAGKGWHHAYVGGLLEHVLSMLQLGEVMARQHAELDRDLMVGGVLLHDIGKIEELALKSYFEYTTPGRLIGHLVQGCLLAGRYLDRIPDFPAELRTRVLHMIVSHHGAVERGSPKPPMTLEATVVHLLDHLDSQAHAVARIVAATRADDGWSEHAKLVDRSFFRGTGTASSDG